MMSALGGRKVAMAALVGLLLRLAWVVAVAQPPSDPLMDSAQYLRLAEGFAELATPTLGGHPTAFYPPGFPITIAPLIALGRAVGFDNPALLAGLLNAVMGTVTIVAGALLTRQWLSARAGVWTAWLLALSPGLIYFSSAAVSETVAGAALLIAMAATTAVCRRSDLETARAVPATLAVGALFGYAILVRSSGALLLFVPAVVASCAGASFRTSVRTSFLCATGAFLVLAPWAIRNGLEVGVWSPLSTNNAANMCGGLRPGATGAYDESDERIRECFADSPFDDPAVIPRESLPEGWVYGERNEGHWSVDRTWDALTWARNNPRTALRLAPQKVLLTLSADDGLDTAMDFGHRPIRPRWLGQVLETLAQIWHFAVLVSSLAALALCAACRRAVPIWAMAVGLLGVTTLGMALERYGHPVMLLAAILAAGLFASIGSPGAEAEVRYHPDLERTA